MQIRSSHTKKLPGALRRPALICFALVAMVSATAMVSAVDTCKSIKLEIPDPKTLKLRDGDHVIAAVDTERGKLEARVNVKNNVAAEPRYFWGGKPLKDTPESEVPESLRDCLKNAGRTASASGNSFRTSAHHAMGWTAPASYVPPVGSCLITSYGCSGGFCCASATCYRSGGGSGYGFKCVAY